MLLTKLFKWVKTILKNSWEDDLSDYAPEHGIERFEVLEYWGMVDVDMS